MLRLILSFTAAEVGSSQVVTSVVEDERRHAALYLDKLEEKMKTHNVKFTFFSKCIYYRANIMVGIILHKMFVNVPQLACN